MDVRDRRHAERSAAREAVLVILFLSTWPIAVATALLARAACRGWLSR